MLKKFIFAFTISLLLAACASTEGRKSEAMVAEGQWFSGYLALGQYMGIPESSEFKAYAAAAHEQYDFVPTFTAGFEQALNAALAPPSPMARETQIERLKEIGTVFGSLGIEEILPRYSIDAMQHHWDVQMAKAYKEEALPIGLDEIPPQAPELARTILTKPDRAHAITFAKIEAGDTKALKALLRASTGPAIENLTRAKLKQARLPFPAWQDHVARYFPELAKQRMAALETRLFLDVSGQNELLALHLRQALQSLAPDITFTQDESAAVDGRLEIKALAYETAGPWVSAQTRTLPATQFDPGFRQVHSKIQSVSWTETTTKMIGHWAIMLSFTAPGASTTQQLVEGEKTEQALVCTPPQYAGDAALYPDDWPRTDLAAHCANKNVPVTRPSYFEDLAITATQNAVLALIAPVRKVHDPAAPKSAALPSGNWTVPE